MGAWTAVRTGHRKHGAARLSDHRSGRRGRERTAARSCRPRIRRPSIDGVGGEGKEPDREHRQPQAFGRAAAQAARFAGLAQRTATGKDKVNPGARRRHRIVRTGLSHGRGRAGDHGSFQRKRSDAGGLRHLASRAPTASAGNACWPGDLPKKGSASSNWAWEAGTSTTICKRKAHLERPRHRQADRRAAGRPETARHAQRHAGRVGRRIRPHPGGPEQRRPRPQQQRLLDVDGRRRSRKGAIATARPTSTASPRSKTRCTSTTCTPRCSICSAWTTRS